VVNWGHGSPIFGKCLVEKDRDTLIVIRAVMDLKTVSFYFFSSWHLSSSCIIIFHHHFKSNSVYLLEVIVCPCVHLSQPWTVVDILSLSTLCSYGTLYCYPSSMIQTQNLSTVPYFTIYVSVNNYFCISANNYFCILLLCLVLCCEWCM